MTGSSRYCEDMGYTSYLFSGEDFQGYYAGSMYTTSTYVMPAVKYNWLFHKGFSCYSKAGLGLSAQHVWFDKAHPNMETQSYEYMREYDHRFHRLEGQLTFIGMEIGKGSLRFFTELGWGLEGVFNIGFSYHFHRF